jgi:hypothetical protein
VSARASRVRNAVADLVDRKRRRREPDEALVVVARAAALSDVADHPRIESVSTFAGPLAEWPFEPAAPGKFANQSDKPVRGARAPRRVSVRQ